MTIEALLGDLFAAAVGGFVLFSFAFPLWVAFTESPAAVKRVRSAYQGLQGLGGPGAEVVSIRKIGSRWGGRSSPPGRIYAVELRFPMGQTKQATVMVEAGLLGPGALKPDKGRGRFPG